MAGATVRTLARACLLAIALGTGGAAAEPAQWHVVVAGQTLGSIARRYRISIEALCNANGIRRRDPIRPGQRLIVPGRADRDGSRARSTRAAGAPAGGGGAVPASESAEALVVPGAPAPAWYFEPTGPGRLGLRPVLMYLHGRGAHPASECRRWARVARRMGWVVCPSGQEDRGGGARGWDNNWPGAHGVVMSTLQALRDKFGRRVQLYGNTLIGFSEGAYVAMNVGVREPRAFNRWLILAADADYWGGMGVEALAQNHALVRRVYLITGKQDMVNEGTLQVRRWLERERVAVRMSMPEDMGHEVRLETKPAMYQAALRWLERGTSR
jgi:predicted esterase